MCASISPDGDWLTFMSMGKQFDIFVMRADGTGRRQLTDDLHRDYWPRWSPDGREIYFYSNRSGSMEIWIIHPDGSGMRQLTDTPGRNLGNPAWSPDGMRMSYFDYTRCISYIFDPKKPWEEQTPLALLPLSDEGMCFHAFSWSPDGHWLAGRDHFGSILFGEIVIYSLETERFRSLHPIGWRDLWLHDSRGLLFVSEAGALHKVDIDSGKSSEVLSLVPDMIFPTDFSPDHKWLYFTHMRWEADIWMLTLSEPR